MNSLNLWKFPKSKLKPITIKAEFIKKANGEFIFGIPSSEIV
jgi:hypothetical protein